MKKLTLLLICFFINAYGTSINLKNNLLRRINSIDEEINSYKFGGERLNPEELKDKLDSANVDLNNLEYEIKADVHNIKLQKKLQQVRHKIQNMLQNQ